MRADSACANDIVVNSKFTQTVFKQSFPLISRVPLVIYPGLRLDAYNQPLGDYESIQT